LVGLEGEIKKTFSCKARNRTIRCHLWLGVELTPLRQKANNPEIVRIRLKDPLELLQCLDLGGGVPAMHRERRPWHRKNEIMIRTPTECLFFSISAGPGSKLMGGCARDPGGSASGTPPYFFTLFPEDCVQPTGVDPSLPEVPQTTPVALSPNSSPLEYSDPSLPEVLHTNPCCPFARPLCGFCWPWNEPWWGPISFRSPSDNPCCFFTRPLCGFCCSWNDSCCGSLSVRRGDPRRPGGPAAGR